MIIKNLKIIVKNSNFYKNNKLIKRDKIVPIVQKTFGVHYIKFTDILCKD